MLTDDERKEFTVYQNWRGQFILRVRHFNSLPHSGEWVDARPSDLPLFFTRLLKGSPFAPR